MPFCSLRLDGIQNSFEYRGMALKCAWALDRPEEKEIKHSIRRVADLLCVAICREVRHERNSRIFWKKSCSKYAVVQKNICSFQE